MITKRRHFLACMAGGMLSGVVPLSGFFSGRAQDGPASANVADIPGNVTCSRGEVSRMLQSVAGASVTLAEQVTWVATATVTLFSLPVFSRRGVGSGYAVVEEARLAMGGNAISIQFGAGSWPETSHGLNRFGLIHEVTVENGAGEPDESAYEAFITSSREKNLDQANQALQSSGTSVPYVAAQAHAAHGRFAARVDALEFPSHYTWRDADSLIVKVRDVISNSACPSESERGGAGLFLYSVHKAMLDARTATRSLFFNGKRFLLETTKQSDPSIGAHLAESHAVTRAADVVRLDAIIREQKAGRESELGPATVFRVWYDATCPKAPPVRFEYQARSFLRLVFELDTNARTPQFGYAIRSKQNS